MNVGVLKRYLLKSNKVISYELSDYYFIIALFDLLNQIALHRVQFTDCVNDNFQSEPSVGYFCSNNQNMVKILF